MAYYASAVTEQLQALEDNEVDFRLSHLKPPHAQWLVNAYNYFTGEKGNSWYGLVAERNGSC